MPIPYQPQPSRPKLGKPDRPDLLPQPCAVVQAFSRASLIFGRARLQLDALWADLHNDPEMRLKRDLWNGLLDEAYGEPVDKDALFPQTPDFRSVGLTNAWEVYR